MLIYARGSARIRHATTGEVFEVHDDELAWEVLDTHERGMGPETVYQAEVHHDELGRLVWTLSEYPAGAEGNRATDVGDHHLEANFEFGLEHEPEVEPFDISDLPAHLVNYPEWAASLTRPALVGYLVEWFHHFYEATGNPAPSKTASDGKVYYPVGPNPVEGELRDNFYGLVPDAALLKAIEAIEVEGAEWVRWEPLPDNAITYGGEPLTYGGEPLTYGEGTYGAGTYGGSTYAAMPRAPAESDQFPFDQLRHVAATKKAIGLGSDRELASRKEVLAKVEAIRLAIQNRHGGMGHNRPPEGLSLPDESVEAVGESLAVVKAELSSPEPNVEVVAEKASVLKGMLKWAADKLNKTIDAFCKGFGSTLGKAAAVAVPVLPFWQQLVDLLGSLKDWLLLALGV